MTDHRARGRARRLVAVFVALFTVPVAFLIVALAATAETQQALSEPCDPTMTECPDPPTEPTDTTPTEEPTSEPTSEPTTAPPTTAPAGGGGGGGSGGDGGGSVPRAPAVPRATTTTTPPVVAVATLAATQGPVQPTGSGTQPAEVAAPAQMRMPSGIMLGSTAGILVAFAVSVAFLVRERRAYVREREEEELEHWRGYR